MLIETTQIVFGPGRFVAAGSTMDLPPAEALDLISAGKARRVVEAGQVETTALGSGPENTMLPKPESRPRPSKR